MTESLIILFRNVLLIDTRRNPDCAICWRRSRLAGTLLPVPELLVTGLPIAGRAQIDDFVEGIHPV